MWDVALGCAEAQRAAKLGLRLLGPEGLVRPGTWQHQWLFQPAFHLAGGSDEVNRNIVAERVLDLPGEPRTDDSEPWKDVPR